MSGEDLSTFDVNGPGIEGKLFGLPHTPENARLIVLPMPWDVTVSYHTGTVNGPGAMLSASRQIDLFHREIPEAWRFGVSMDAIPADLPETNRNLRILADQCRRSPDPAGPLLEKINEACGTLNIYVRKRAEEFISRGKIVGLVGGDHSTPLGLLRALAGKHDRFGILQIDAHADLRKAYEGFAYSHGSIMYNALKSPAIGRLVQVGVRDLCQAEYAVIERGGGRVKTFYDDALKQQLSSGSTWESLSKTIVNALPEKVYISFDIDGLDARYCPNTGTPVPGGLDFHQAVDLIRSVAVSGRKIIGFDLCEVAPGPQGDWDANVGARILWQLSCWTGVSNGFLKPLAQ